MKPLSRRTVLKGMGASLALPILDAMLPKAAWAAPETLVRNRMAFVYIPNGAIMPHWTPTKPGKDYDLPKTLQPLKKHKDELLVISGLAHDLARSHGDGAGDHARDSAVFLTASRPRKSDSDIFLGQSVDQLAADQVGHWTRLPSLELGTEAGRQAGRCDSGYSCAYQSNISWKGPTTPMAKEIRPRAVFERMFGGDQDPKVLAQRTFYRQSILDFVSEDVRKLSKQLGASDQQKLDQYFTSVREIEQRIDRAATMQPKEVPDVELPDDVPRDYAEHVRLMYDLMVLAFKTDTTRICTLMMANSGSNRTYKEIGVKEAHHQLSHHRNDEEKMASLQRIDEYMVTQFGYFLDQLSAEKEGDGTLLDHSMILYGAAISDANRHQHDHLPVLLAGRGNGTVTPGRHLEVSGKETPMANLYVSLLGNMGVDVERFGDSTGRLSEIKV